MERAGMFENLEASAGLDSDSEFRIWFCHSEFWNEDPIRIQLWPGDVDIWDYGDRHNPGKNRAKIGWSKLKGTVVWRSNAHHQGLSRNYFFQLPEIGNRNRFFSQKSETRISRHPCPSCKCDFAHATGFLWMFRGLFDCFKHLQNVTSVVQIMKDPHIFDCTQGPKEFFLFRH